MTENTVINALHTRRSVLAANMAEPGPSAEQIDSILAAAHRVPDHGKLGPWRFIIFQGEARSRFGEALGKRFLETCPGANEKQLEFESARFMRAPVVISVISSITPEHKVPVWEQELSAGAACQNILLAASAFGFGAQWLTEWYAFDKKIDSELGLTESERVAGFIYIGSFDEKPKERVRPELASRVSFY